MTGVSGFNVTRRDFVRQAAGAAGMFLLSAESALTADDRKPINLAVIGDMYVGSHFITSIHSYPGVNIVALCDPDERKFAKTFEIWKERAETWPTSTKPEERKAADIYRRLTDASPRAFSDFRRMLAEMGEGIDAVVVSQFDHLHGPMAGAAMRAGKHVFSERPLGLTIREARALRELAPERKVATSIRNPGNASNQFRRGVELIRDGVLGAVEEVHVWFDRGGADLDSPPAGTPPVPEGLHWDLWLGPASERPYHPQWLAYAQWRDFSNGGIGTFGPHAANLPFMALRVHELWNASGEGTPSSTMRVQAQVSRINRISFPRWEIVRWQVPARGDLPPVTFTWHNGPKHAPRARELIQQKMLERSASADDVEKALKAAGTLIIGSKGTLLSDDHNVKFTLYPQEQFQGIEQTQPKSLPTSRGHYNDWLDACRGGAPAWANFGYAGPLSEFLTLGNIATQFEEELEYDPRAGKIVNHPEADRKLGYEYRQGWTL